MTTNGFWSGKRVLVTGGAGFIGSYVIDRLVRGRGVPRESIVVPRSADCDLREYLNAERAVAGCDVVIHLAAVTGGMAFSRTHPASQYYATSFIDLNVVEAARRAGVKKLVAIGNLFAYAADAPLPLAEDTLFDGLPSAPHRGIGWVKRNLALIADLYHREYGFPMVVVYSANAYGPRDSLDRERAHVIPATIMKCLAESELVVWGDGTPTRDFLFAEDVAEGLLLAAEKLDAPQYVNVGSGVEVSIREVTELIVKYSNFRGTVRFDATKPGGDPRRNTDVSRGRTALGFQPRFAIDEGMKRTVAWYRENFKPNG
jgi:GDP-L-fucose synthase